MQANILWTPWHKKANHQISFPRTDFYSVRFFDLNKKQNKVQKMTVNYSAAVLTS